MAAKGPPTSWKALAVAGVRAEAALSCSSSCSDQLTSTIMFPSGHVEQEEDRAAQSGEAAGMADGWAV